MYLGIYGSLARDPFKGTLKWKTPFFSVFTYTFESLVALLTHKRPAKPTY